MTAQLHKSAISHLHHELRNPLTVISSYAQLLQRRAVASGDIKTEQGAMAISRSAERLTDMVRAATDAMKLSAGAFSFSEELVQLQPLIEKTVADAQNTCTNHVFSLHGCIAAEVLVDSSRFQQALLAILDNAAKFSPESPQIEVFLAKTRAHLKISVRDRGVGIPPSVLEKLPQPYYQGDASSPLRLSGLGLGLFLAKASITHFGGTLVLSSAELGTLVEISIPKHD